MQSLRSSILKYMRVKLPLQVASSQAEGRSSLNILNLQIRTCSSSGATNQDQIKEQVLNLVKKFDKIDATKVQLIYFLLSESFSSFLISTFPGSSQTSFDVKHKFMCKDY